MDKFTRYVTAHGNGIYAIIGREEIVYYDFDTDDYINTVKDFPKELAFITLCDPNKEFIETDNHFSAELKLKFWDIEQDCGNHKVLTEEHAKQIREFIIENKDKQFLINCEAGVSRSAAVGMAVEYFTRDEWIKWEHVPSKVIQHWRYSPNMLVFHKVTETPYLKTSNEWDLDSEYDILDPDGWDRTNYTYSFFEEKITQEEFNRRLIYSTVIKRS